MASYEEVIEVAIEKESNVLGEEAAINAAQDVEGLNVDDDGNILGIDGSGKKVIEKLVSNYEDIGGSVTASLIARKIKDVGAEDLDLPEVLEQRM